MGRTTLFLVVVVALLGSGSAWLFKTREYTDAAKPVNQTCKDWAAQGDCRFYLCLNERHPCGNSGYAFRHGWVICNRFKANVGRFTEEFRMWLPETRKCSMSRLLPSYEAERGSCDVIEDEGEESWAHCAVEKGVCSGDLFWDNRQPLLDVYTFRDTPRVLRNIKGCGVRLLGRFIRFLIQNVPDIQLPFPFSRSRRSLDAHSVGFSLNGTLPTPYSAGWERFKTAVGALFVTVISGVEDYFSGDKKLTPSAVPSNSTCTNYARNHDCRFYLCLRDRHPCHATRDLYRVNWILCRRMEENRFRLTPKARDWISRTTNCTMLRLLPAYETDKAICGSMESELWGAWAYCSVKLGACDNNMLWNNRHALLEIYSLRDIPRMLADAHLCGRRHLDRFIIWAGEILKGHLEALG